MRRKIVAPVSFLACVGLYAASPQDAARQAMAASVARQAQAVAAVRISIAKQHAAIRSAALAPTSRPPEAEQFFTLSWPALGPNCNPMADEEINPLLEQAAQKEGLDKDLLRAVAEQESGFRACAVSPRGAMGLMQIMPGTAHDLGLRDPFDPRENLSAGARFLKQLLGRFGGDTAVALGAYNAGPGRIEDTGGVPEIPETVEYVQRILSRLPLP